MYGPKAKKIFFLLAVIVIGAFVLTGCGGKKVAKPTAQEVAEDQKKVQAVTDFDTKVRPLFEETQAIYEQLTKSVTRFGYGEVDKATLDKVSAKVVFDTKATLQKIEAIEAEGEYEGVKGGLSTCLNLRLQEYEKLEKLLKANPKPKGSELNMILEGLRSTQGFFDKGLAQMETIESQVGFTPKK